MRTNEHWSASSIDPGLLTLLFQRLDYVLLQVIIANNGGSELLGYGT